MKAQIAKIAFCASLLVLYGCPSDDRPDHTFLFEFCAGSLRDSSAVTFTDLGDGTVERRDAWTRSGPCGSYSGISAIGYAKKCLQGQVYRSAENDCRGTGNAGDNWGAQTFQFCPTNDTSCEINGFADPATSPAAMACAQDTTAGRTWRLETAYAQKMPQPGTAGGPPSVFPDLAFDGSHFWTNAGRVTELATPGEAGFFSFDSQGNVSGGSDVNTTLNYVLCAAGAFL